MKTFRELFESMKDTPEYLREELILNFTEAVAIRMEDLGITNSELAERIGVSKRVVLGIKRGETNPSYATLVKIAGALGCRVKIVLTPRDKEE